MTQQQEIIGMIMPLPYITLAGLVLALFTIRSSKVKAVLLAGQIFLGFMYGIIDPVGVLAAGIFWGLCALHWRNPTTKPWMDGLRTVTLVLVALAFANHMVLGFHNVRALDGILVSPEALPFTMYLNFDKVVAAIILATTSNLFLKRTQPFGVRTWGETIALAAICIMILAPLALLSGYVDFTPKFSQTFWLWALNNLLFVCFAEEVVFRGILQNYLMRMASSFKISPLVPVVISAILFATTLLGHLHGGPVYIGFALVAGLFYGYTYHRTGRLESAILVHFMVNLCHFLLFSYPASASILK